MRLTRLLPFFLLACLGTAQAQSLPSGKLADLSPYAGAAMALVRNTTTDAPARIDLVLLDPVSRQVIRRHPTTLDCERVYLAQTTIFCLGVPKLPGQGGTANFRVASFAFKDDFSGSVSTGTTVSRARMSADGLHASSTMFVTGHSYGADVFSTEVLVIDLKRKKLTLPPLEYWEILQKNVRISPRDLNFWGVTFDPRNPDAFYVTAAYGKKIFLAKGQISARRIELLQAGIECPSLSPDGSRIAFKKKTGEAKWMPAILDLASGTETVFPQKHNVDDQIEWLDEHTLLYEIRTPRFAGASSELMQLDLRQPQQPARLWLKDAASPAVSRINAAMRK